MRIQVRHTTRYKYEAPARYIVQTLRVTPPDFIGQSVKSWKIATPGIESAIRFTDGFGNNVQLVALEGSFDEVAVELEGVVDTDDRMGVVQGLPERAPLRVYLRETDATRPDAAIRKLATGFTARDRLGQMHELMHRVHGAVRYEIGATHAHTSAIDALTAGKGVCQDHAHIFISAARTIGIPARYVNGYFVNGGPGWSEAHHAWAEVWIDGLDWVGFDPANLLCPTDRYVRLAWGLDAASAAPVRGTTRGALNETLDVTVEVQQQPDRLEAPRDQSQDQRQA